MITRNMLGVLLISSLWITFVLSAPFELNGDSTVPEIEDCVYVNAYYVTCWWKRPTGDTTTTFRLGYTSDADHPHDKREKYCDVTQQRTDDDATIESCGIHGTMFERFTLWVGSVQDCDVTTASCETSHRSDDVTFICNRESVQLTIPPGSLNVVEDGHRLTWEPPEREDSMLGFVLHTVGVMYKVEYREIFEGLQSEWGEWYRGYDTNVFLPTLIPGSTYEVRITASLDPVTSLFNPSPASGDAQREWTEPSHVLVFMVPRTMKFVSEVTIIEVKKDVEISDQTNSSVTADDVGRPLQVSERIVIAASVTSFFIVLILALVCYFVPWQRWCCKLQQTKFVKPRTFLNFEKDGNIGSMNESAELEKGNGARAKENVCSIMDAIDWNFEEPSIKANPENIVFARMKTNEPDCPDYTCQLVSPFTNLAQVLSLNDILDNVTTPIVDVISPSDVIEMRQKKNPSPVIDRLSLVKETGSISYVGLGEESGMPNYLTTTEKDGMLSDSFNRSSSGYVIDDTGVESAFSDDVTSYEEYEEKQKQWENYMINQGGGSDDDVPDYVIQDPSTSKDFSLDMTTFLSMATEDVGQPEPTNIHDETQGLLSHNNDKIRARLPDKKDISNRKNSSSPLVITPMCSSCNSSQSDIQCLDVTDNTGLEMNLQGRATISHHSIDSGYSPDSTDCGLMSPNTKRSFIPKMFVIGDIAASGDGESSDNEMDYMTYVTT